MTIDEAIAHAQETADTRSDLCDECRDEHRQLADWLAELKQLRESFEKQKSINYELVDENQELINENEELKRLLRLAVDALKKVSEENHSYCLSDGICDECDFTAEGNKNWCKWKYAEEAMKLIGDEDNG